MINNATPRHGARGRTLFIVLSLVLGCRSAPAQPRVATGDARVYAAGRRHEIEFTTTALAMLACATTQDQRSVIVAGASPDRAEIAAAARIGMRVVIYQAITTRVDSMLRATRELDARTRGLDSLRVRLTILRTRMTAPQSPQPAFKKTTLSRSTKCNAK